MHALEANFAPSYDDQAAGLSWARREAYRNTCLQITSAAAALPHLGIKQVGSSQRRIALMFPVGAADPSVSSWQCLRWCEPWHVRKFWQRRWGCTWFIDPAVSQLSMNTRLQAKQLFRAHFFRKLCKLPGKRSTGG